MLSWKLLPPMVTGVSTPNVPWLLPNENIWLLVKLAVYTNDLVVKRLIR